MSFPRLTVSRTSVFRTLLFAFVFTIPLSSFISVRLMMLTLVAAFFLKTRPSIGNLTAKFWDVFIYLGLLVIGLSYSSDITRGLRLLETRFSLLAIPVIFWRADLATEDDMFQIAKYFARGVILACLICVANAAYTYWAHGDNEAFVYENLTSIISIQPTYVAYYIIFSITFGLYVLYYYPRQAHRNLTLISVLFLFIMLMLTGGRTTFVSLLLTFGFVVLKFILEDKASHKRTVFVIVCAMLVTLFIVNSVEQFSFQGDYWERAVLWRSAISANPSPLFGVGTGDFNKVLNDYYLSHDLAQFAEGDYNAHNQFIQAYLTHGLVGLSLILLILARPIYFGAKNHDTLTILIFFPFLIYGTTEVFLGRYQGVVFFALVQAMSTVLARRDRMLTDLAAE